MPDIVINGIQVTFPFPPYKVQEDYMAKVIECLQNKKHGVLESPTGTGKTLSMLCSSLSWLLVKKAQLQAQALMGGIEKPEFGGKFFENLTNSLDNAAGASTEVSVQNPNFGWAMPKIIYASRTHSQLSQAMQELKRTSYKHVKVAVIGSRDQLCIHPEVSKEQNSANKIHMCQAKVRARTCFYFNNVELRKDDPLFKNEICDIEDLVKNGQKLKCCPYFLAKELKTSADITFMPYNYLLDPKTRKSQGIDLQNYVILLDEAHNVEKTCEEAASLQISSTDIALCIDEVTKVMKDMAEEKAEDIGFNLEGPGNSAQKDFTPEDLCVLKIMFLAVEKAVDEIPLKLGSEGETYPGGYIFELLEKADLTHGKEQIVIEKLDKIILYLSTISTSPFARRGNSLQKFCDFLRTVFSGGGSSNSFKHRERVKQAYKVYVQPEEAKKIGRNDGWEPKKPAQKAGGKLISYWCFSPGFGMQQLLEQGVHSIILTSGTLSPLKPFISELGIPIDVQLENPHIVTGNQVCAGVLSQGPDSHPLNSSYNTRNDPKYISALGRTLYNFSCLIPHGLLVFFPSYPMMKKCRDDWQSSGLWSTISEKKPIFVEPQTKDSFNSVMNDFYQKIQDPTHNGAIFLAVCRGKVSEGLDFANANGRAVLITGLPFPPLKDPRVMLKQRYLEEMRVKNKEGLSGQQWYQLEASRAVNQAIGRIIRHKDDYGAIILCDTRFNNASFKGQLSSWLRPHIKNFSNFGIVTRELRNFFKTAEATLPQPKGTSSREFSLPAVPASFEYSSKTREGSSLKVAETAAPEENFNIDMYKPEKVENNSSVKRKDFSNSQARNVINFGTLKAVGGWSQSELVQNSTSLEPAPKKRKLKIQPIDFTFNAQPSTSRDFEAENGNGLEKKSPGDEKKELGRVYLKEVKRSLSDDNYKIFAKMIQVYTTTGDFDELLKTLEELFPVGSGFERLFNGFRSFLKKQHISAFDTHTRK
ncbi:regulator of telomere elongation helicase 1 homolog [Diachasmimorpha longicaudata]|uniref:regulator of telomere elongation helicase 1 homolog n=1 Tax=Diachasmimorpha longicaudata TaxID=58733 RepID=UPI0030B8C86C